LAAGADELGGAAGAEVGEGAAGTTGAEEGGAAGAGAADEAGGLGADVAGVGVEALHPPRIKEEITTRAARITRNLFI